jgi:hypothetical protein
MAQAPQNIRAVDAAIDGTYVKIAWDDPNASTSSVRLWDSTGAWERPWTRSGTTGIVLAGPYHLSIKTSDGQESSKVAFSVTAQAPVPLTARQHLEAAVGALDDDSQVAVYPEPAAVLTVRADGTLTPA